MPPAVRQVAPTAVAICAELEREIASARSELRAEVVNMAIGAAEMLIRDRLDDAKHRQLVEDYIQSLGDVRG